MGARSLARCPLLVLPITSLDSSGPPRLTNAALPADPGAGAGAGTVGAVMRSKIRRLQSFIMPSILHDATTSRILFVVFVVLCETFDRLYNIRVDAGNRERSHRKKFMREAVLECLQVISRATRCTKMRSGRMVTPIRRKTSAPTESFVAS